MDLRQLRAFVAVFETRNITQAAARLHVTQPTLSATLRQLEDTLASPLFARLPRGVAATDAARRLFPQAKRLIADADALAARFRDPSAGQTLTLGIETDLGDAQLAHLLCTALALGTVRLTLASGCAGDARLACETQRCEDELFLPLWEEAFVLALPPGHPLAGQTVGAAQLAQTPWVMCPTHASHPRLLALLGEYAPAHPHRVDSLALAAQLVRAGGGVAWLPGTLITGQAQATLAAPPYQRRVGLCYAPDALASPALRSLLDALA